MSSSSPERTVTLRTLLLAVLATFVLSTVTAIGVSSMLIGAEPGPRGPQGGQGPQGLRGEVGPAGEPTQAEVSAEEDVWTMLENDPSRVNALLDPAPGDLQTDVEQVQSDLSSLCSELTFSDALSSEVLTCP